MRMLSEVDNLMNTCSGILFSSHLHKQMEVHSEVLQLIISKLDNNSIQSLSLVPGIWTQISQFASKQYFWFLRTQELVFRELPWMEGDWKEAYYILSKCTTDIYNNEDNVIAASIVMLLGVDPSQCGGYLIGEAAENGRINIVRLLLRDKRVDPSARNNSAIKGASYEGHTEIVRLLLEDKRADPAVYDSYPLVIACEHNHVDIVRLLLEDRRADPSDKNNSCINVAAYEGYTEVMRLLLEDGRVDPSPEENYPLRVASKKDHTEVVRLLLRDGRICNSESLMDDIDQAIRDATRKKYHEIVKMLEEFSCES